MSTRDDRRHTEDIKDKRISFLRDRDRILYSSAFRRLSGVTQIVRTGESDAFHDRMIHSLKVAQVGRRLAEICRANQLGRSEQWGLDLEVVEAACIAHDLGHPPFGHIGETTLSSLVECSGDPEGYEGNAQSFRILTKLSVGSGDFPGLNLSRATLAAVLKYPWTRDISCKNKKNKWSVYESEVDDFRFAQELLRGETKTLEAEIMDWADDITYSVHDIEDFNRCGAIPWYFLRESSEVQDQLVTSANDKWFEKPDDSCASLRAALLYILKPLALVSDISSKPYEGSREQRQQIRWLTSRLIEHFVKGITILNPTELGDDERCVSIDQERESGVRILKQITQNFILNNPALSAQQVGHKRVIKELFNDFMEDIQCYPNKQPKIFPIRLRYVLDDDVTVGRKVADCIASFTESEAMAFHGRLRGTASGSVLDPIAR